MSAVPEKQLLHVEAAPTEAPAVEAQVNAEAAGERGVGRRQVFLRDDDLVLDVTWRSARAPSFRYCAQQPLLRRVVSSILADELAAHVHKLQLYHMRVVRRFCDLDAVSAHLCPATHLLLPAICTSNPTLSQLQLVDDPQRPLLTNGFLGAVIELCPLLTCLHVQHFAPDAALLTLLSDACPHLCELHVIGMLSLQIAVVERSAALGLEAATGPQLDALARLLQRRGVALTAYEGFVTALNLIFLVRHAPSLLELRVIGGGSGSCVVALLECCRTLRFVTFPVTSAHTPGTRVTQRNLATMLKNYCPHLQRMGLT